jgi:hypothetical protein
MHKDPYRPAAGDLSCDAELQNPIQHSKPCHTFPLPAFFWKTPDIALDRGVYTSSPKLENDSFPPK